MIPRTCLLTVALLALGLAGCDDMDSPTSPTSGTLSAEGRAALERAIQDEYKAETTYEGVLNDLGSVQPFLLVVEAERQHVESLAQLFRRRDLPVPASAWTLDGVPHFTSLRAACLGAAAAERENIAMYDELLRLDLPRDVQQVFTNNRSASLQNHLPAFERCS